jgi:hypothetical protein
MHPIDRLIRRIQTEAPSRKLEIRIARALYGDDVIWCAKTKRHLVVRNTRSLKIFEVPRYTATREVLQRTVIMLRRRKAELELRAPLRIAA